MSAKRTAKPGTAGKPGKAMIASLAAAAHRARDNAYAPYSKYRVGAAIATASGKIHAGCNVENAAYPSGICAERAAIAAMVTAGDRDPIACVIVTGGKVPGPPCGMCRQVLVEFARKMSIILIGVHAGGETRRTLDLETLMPEVFVLKP